MSITIRKKLKALLKESPFVIFEPFDKDADPTHRFTIAEVSSTEGLIKAMKRM